MKKFIILLIFILLGAVLGTFVASLLGGISFLKWLGFGVSAGFMADSPLVLDLVLLKIVFGIQFSINVAQILFVALSVLAFMPVSKRL